jgi:hypothetical protein
MSTTDQALFSQVQYHLLEAPDGGQAWISQLWTRDEIVALANQAQDQLLYETLLLVTTGSVVVAPGDFLLALPTDCLRLVTVVWRGAGGTIRELQRTDSFELDHAAQDWGVTQAVPLGYVEDDVPGTLTVRIGPSPTEAGTLDLLYLPAGTPLTGSNVPLTVIDELAHALKYGILGAALNKDGRGKDPARAAYCTQRVDLAVQATQLILRGGWSG